MPEKQVGSHRLMDEADYEDEKQYLSHNAVQGHLRLRPDFGDAKVVQEENYNPRTGSQDKFCLLLRAQSYFRDYAPDWSQGKKFTRYFYERRLMLDVGSVPVAEQRRRLALCTENGCAYIAAQADVDEDRFSHLEQRAVAYARKYAKVAATTTTLPGIKIGTGEYIGIEVPTLRPDFDGRLIGMEQPRVFAERMHEVKKKIGA